jgi:hypothetical protein
MLYQPTAGEINRLIHAGIANHPEHTAYYERAHALLKGDHLDYTPAGWIMTSQSTSETYALSTWTCNCRHYQTGGIKIKGRRYCKHLIAYHAYKTILERHLNRRLIGSYSFESDRDIARNYPNALLIIMNGYTCAFADMGRLPRTIARVSKTKFGYKFYHPPAVADFAEWLATALPAPKIQPMKLSTPTATNTELQHEWTQTMTTEQLANLRHPSLTI